MRRLLNKDGKFIPLNPNAAKENVGFHWNALASMSWGKLAELYLRAKIAARKGDSSLLQQFYQKRLALPWKEFAEDYRLEIASGSYNSGDAWDEEAGFNKLGEIIAPPFAGNEVIAPLRIMSVDVQMNCFYLVVRSWSINGSSRLLWHEKVLTWEDIEDIQQRFSILSNLVFIDAGYNSYEVYKQCGKHHWITVLGQLSALNAQKFTTVLEALQKQQTTDISAHDAAFARSGDDGASFRRIMYFSAFFVLAACPFIFAWFDQIPIAVETTEQVGGWLWGLIPEKEVFKIAYVRGFYLAAEWKELLANLISAYIGAGLTRHAFKLGK